MSVLRNIKIIVAWLAIMVLGIFVAMNTQAIELRMPFDIGLRAPLSLVLLATALLGVVGASTFGTLGRWARGKQTRATPGASGSDGASVPADRRSSSPGSS